MSMGEDNGRVSKSYRELADESTSADLDKDILALAAGEARSRYGLARAWTRPVAWAATIGLSLAFLLEMTWFADAPPEPEAAPPVVSEERARRDFEVMKAKQENGLRQGIAERPPGEAAPPRADAVAAFVEAAEQEQRCDSEVRTSAESWYACILELRSEGLIESADAEMEALIEAFPDFQEPEPK